MVEQIEQRESGIFNALRRVTNNTLGRIGLGAFAAMVPVGVAHQGPRTNFNPNLDPTTQNISVTPLSCEQDPSGGVGYAFTPGIGGEGFVGLRDQRSTNNPVVIEDGVEVIDRGVNHRGDEIEEIPLYGNSHHVLVRETPNGREWTFSLQGTHTVTIGTKVVGPPAHQAVLTDVTVNC